MHLAPVKKDEITDDVYRQFVYSLFSNGHVLLIGGIVYVLIATMAYVRTENPAYLLVAPVLLAGNLWRYFGLRAFHERPDDDGSVEVARRWERDYIIRGCAQGLAVGAFCFLSIYVYPDPYAEVCSIAMAVGSLVTVASRNYGSPRMVRILSICFLGPAAIAFLLRGDLAYVLVGVMLLPMMVITISSAGYVRTVLFSAIIGQKRADEIALRFDHALNTMPQGLLMVDKAGTVIVANTEAAELLKLPSQDVVVSRSISSLLRRSVVAGLMEKNQCQYAISQIMRGLRDGSDRKLIIALLDGRSFELTTREGDNDLSVVIFEDVTERVRASERINIMARFDTLTELPNRAHFHELIAQRLNDGDPDRLCALAIFDLDDFKGVNDSLGHSAGDKLIQTIGRRLAEFASADTIVGRLGGDEFVMFYDNVKDEADLRSRIDANRSRLFELVEISGTRIAVEASGGAVLTEAASGVDTMIVRADLALHASKSQQRNNWLLFEDSMEQSFRMREMLKADLRTAIRERALRIVYQPIIRLDTMKIATCEALCRWDHPGLGQISPAIFIPLAEETGLISEITSFVLEQASNDCLKWPEQIGVSVNLSAKDLAHADIIAKVANALATSGLAADRLEVEMTETSLINDKSTARAYVEEIRKLGVQIALDDFGTGYSSLSYLHRLPLDKIKIDRSFLLDMESDERSRELLKSTVELSRRLGMKVTVEGVETFDQLKLLVAEVHPDLVQGFLFGAALSASGIETMSKTAWKFAGSSKVIAPARRSRKAARTAA